MVSTLLALSLVSAFATDQQRVGDPQSGAALVPTGETVRPYGRSIGLTVRPKDLVAGGGNLVWVKDSAGVTLVDVAGKVIASHRVPGATSLTGLCLSRDRTRLYVTNAASQVHLGRVSGTKLTWDKPIELPKPSIGGEAYGCGVLELRDGRLAVALSRSNAVAFIDPSSKKVVGQPISVDIAPYDLALSPDGRSLLVSCWSRRPGSGESTASSAGTPVPVLSGGGAKEGTVVLVDVPSKKVRARTAIGLQPTEIVVTRKGVAYVAVANSDTIGVIDSRSGNLLREIYARVVDGLPFGCAPNALALSADEKRLYVAFGGANAIGIYDLTRGEKLIGLVPTGWYPSGVLPLQGRLVSTAAKGWGSRGGVGTSKGRGVYQFTGLVTVAPMPKAKELATLTARAKADALLQRATAQGLAARPNRPQLPVPERVGEPSVFEHVVYILKENRTYDQLFGDLEQGDGDPSLCVFPREVTPNHHALAEQFVLLDNYYCNGVLSADGHAWSTEAIATTYFERAFGGWTRSYPFGDDPLAVSSRGYLWDDVLRAGRTFRNWGEFDYAEPQPKGSFKEILDDYVAGTGKFSFSQNIGVAQLRSVSDRETPGWNMLIPDVLRAGRFLEDLKRYEEGSEKLPNLSMVYLPQDHGSGTTPGMPTPRAHMADNDLALGRVVDALTKSRFWPKTVIFVIEDDPQDGFDHVDGHRSICLVVSPYTKRGVVISDFFNQTSVVGTMRRILGLPPMTLYDARSPLMGSLFNLTPDLTPFTHLPANIALDELNPPKEAQTRSLQALLDRPLDLSRPDSGDDDRRNRMIWHSAKGELPYPSHMAGAHGKGLARRGLSFDR